TQENLNNQRDAVKEEKRLNYDNRPYSNAFLRLNELIYRNPRNAHSTIGSMEDLDDATIEDVREFFRIYYAPNNAVIAIVGDFDGSRLYQRLVKDEESVVGIQGGIGERRGPSTLYVFAIPKPGHSTGAIRSTIQEEIKRLATEGPSPDEMEKLRNTLLNDTVRNRQSTLYRAQRLAEFTLYDGDPDIVNTELERYLAVTPDEIKSAVSRYLLTDNHSIMEVVPAHMADAEEKPAPAQAPPPGEP